MKISTGFYLLLGILLPSLGWNYVMRERLACAAAASAEAQARAAEAHTTLLLERARADAPQQGDTTPPMLVSPATELPIVGTETNGTLDPGAAPAPTELRCCSALNLNLTQIQTMSEKCAIACDTAQTVSAEATVVVAQLEACLAAPAVDRDRIHSLLDQLFALRRKELESKVDAILTVRDTLTPEQIEKLKKMVRGEE